MRRRFAARAYHFASLKYLGASTHVNFSVSLITLQHKITSMFHLYIIFLYVLAFNYFLLFQSFWLKSSLYLFTYKTILFWIKQLKWIG